MKRVRIKVLGKVQGVFYRRCTQDKARKLGLTGYVANLEDGSVEVLAQGGDAKVTELIEWCREGSPSAAVEQVLVDDDDGNDIYLDFSIL